MPRSSFVAAAFTAAVLIAAPARADVVLTPFIGGNFGGSAASPLADAVGDPSRTTFGGSVAIMAGRVFGIEADLGYTPKFFGTGFEIGGVPVEVARSNVLTAMVNLTAGVPLETRSGTGVRPYVVGGLGMVRQQFSVAAGLLDHSVSDLGYTVGGGVMAFFGPNVGLRGDVRHIRAIGGSSLTDLLDLDVGRLNFTRATVGVVFRY